MEIYKSKYCSLEFHKEHNVISHIWTKESLNMTEEEYKKEVSTNVDFIIELKPTRFFADNTDMFFTISTDLQKWSVSVYDKIPKLDVKSRTAIVMSKDFFSMVSLEQTLEENNFEEDELISIKYFDEREEAWNWLIK